MMFDGSDGLSERLSKTTIVVRIFNSIGAMRI